MSANLRLAWRAAAVSVLVLASLVAVLVATLGIRFSRADLTRGPDPAGLGDRLVREVTGLRSLPARLPNNSAEPLRTIQLLVAIACAASTLGGAAWAARGRRSGVFGLRLGVTTAAGAALVSVWLLCVILAFAHGPGYAVPQEMVEP